MKKNNSWNIRRLVNDSFVPLYKQPRVLYCKLTDFKSYSQNGSMYFYCTILKQLNPLTVTVSISKRINVYLLIYTFIFKCGRIGGMQLKLLMAIAYLMSPQLIACAVLWLRLASKQVGGRIVGQCVYKSKALLGRNR